MVAFLDIGLLQSFGVILPFLFIFALSYALLIKYEILGKDKGLNALIAFSIASILLLSKKAIALVFFTVPWFIILVLFLFFIYFIFMFMGVSEDTWASAWKVWDVQHYWVLAIMIVILLAGLASVFGPSLASDTDPSFPSDGVSAPVAGIENIESTADKQFESRVTEIFFHPKILGLTLLLLIATLAVKNLT